MANRTTNSLNMEIDNKTISATSGCERNFDCLKSGRFVFCRVEECINKKVHFVKNIDKLYCNYKMSFGDSSVCTCPTRKEIFNRYSQ